MEIFITFSKYNTRQRCEEGNLLLEVYNLKKVKLATVVKGDQKVPFSIATTPGFRGGRYSFHWIAPLYPWYVPYIAEC